MRCVLYKAEIDYKPVSPVFWCFGCQLACLSGHGDAGKLQKRQIRKSFFDQILVSQRLVFQKS